MHRSHRSTLVATAMVLAMVSPTAKAATTATAARPRAKATTTKRALITVAKTTATTAATTGVPAATTTVPPPLPQATGSINVFAAASLTEIGRAHV